MSDAQIRAFLDESSAYRGADSQAYLICAALIPSTDVDEMREHLKPLKRRGQIKLHWTDESAATKKRIVDAIADLSPMTAVVTHLSKRQKKTERFRRLCLETLYLEFEMMKVHHATLEARTEKDNVRDRAHITALRSKGVCKDLRIEHERGGEEPLLWIPDILLGAINAAEQHGEPAYLQKLQETIVFRERTPSSDAP